MTVSFSNTSKISTPRTLVLTLNRHLNSARASLLINSFRFLNQPKH
jgi:hypothetical protein